MLKKVKNRILSINPSIIHDRFVEPRILLLIFQLLAFTLALFSPENIIPADGLKFLLVMVITFVFVSYFPRWTKGDSYILLISCMMYSIGLVMIYRLRPNEGSAQMIWYILGIATLILIFGILKVFPYWRNLTGLYFIAITFLFVIVLLLGTGDGATNWISIAGKQIQPSELNKVLLVFYLSSFHTNRKFLKKYEKYKPWILMFTIYFFVIMFFLQRELGTALIFFVYYFIYIFITDADKKLIITNILLAIFGAIFAYLLFNHLRERVDIWLDPWKTANSTGYQIIQSLIAISSGGYFGTGINLGQPYLIPVATSDFVFASIVEEMGIFTGMGLIMLFLILIYRGFKIAIEQINEFNKFMALGMTIVFAIQALVIFGGVLKLIPLTGITIPFVSYGGSSIISSFIQLAVLYFYSSELSNEKRRS